MKNLVSCRKKYKKVLVELLFTDNGLSYRMRLLEKKDPLYGQMMLHTKEIVSQGKKRACVESTELHASYQTLLYRTL